MSENATPANFQPGIHTPDFWDEYMAKQIRASALADCSRPKESLGGQWHYGIDQYDTCLRNKWYLEQTHDENGRPLPQDASFDEWETMVVPSCWNMHSEKLFLYEGSVVYTRRFAYERGGAMWTSHPTTDNSSSEGNGGNEENSDLSERVFLKFGGANYRTLVFLNQTYLGLHQGGSTPFYIEITDVIKSANRLLVVVNNTRRRESVPMDNTDWFNYGGLYRDVELLRLPLVFIRSFSIGLIPDNSCYSSPHIFVETRIDGALTGIATLRIPELNIAAEIPIADGSGRIELAADPELWSPEHPRLYEVSLGLNDDLISDRVGFRTIRTAGNDILLNGNSCYLKGVSLHEDSAAHGKAVTEAEIRASYALAKELGANFIRLAHYPHAEAAARIADEVGLLLWEEIPVYWAIDFGNPATYADAENQLGELITRDINRASVIIWSVGNENPDTDERLSFMGGLAERARELDGTRLVAAACLVDHERLVISDRLAARLDIIGINEYYGWYDPDFVKLPLLFENSAPEKPVVISEFGADAKAGYRGGRDEMYTEDFQLDVYEKQIETLSRIDYVRGISPWIFIDFRCPRRLHPRQGYYNIKGLVAADRKYRKLAYYALQEYYCRQ
ncbi:MAG: glycoside hydrolase family 2 [Lachnospiraceae bacterium]|jgi:beta-glucuronidase|nr:glycoside hydrolase family 2 [Lachnospiraceae bacterium]